MTTLLVYKAMFVICLVFLLCINVRIYAVGRTKKLDEMPTLRWLSFGMNLSALSYVVRIVEFGHPNIMSAAPSLCIAGTVAIAIGWLRLTEVIANRAMAAKAILDQKNKIHSEEIGDQIWASALGLEDTKLRITGLLGATVLLALNEAERCSRCEIDTEHLLIGLLKEPYGLGKHLLQRMNVGESELRAALLRAAPTLSHELSRKAKRVSMPKKVVSLDNDAVAGLIKERLSKRSLEVFRYAAAEAHRFDSDHIGTEHLLLGLALRGDGAAAHALLQSGANVDKIREEIIAIKSMAPIAVRTHV